MILHNNQCKLFAKEWQNSKSSGRNRWPLKCVKKKKNTNSLPNEFLSAQNKLQWPLQLLKWVKASSIRPESFWGGVQEGKAWKTTMPQESRKWRKESFYLVPSSLTNRRTFQGVEGERGPLSIYKSCKNCTGFNRVPWEPIFINWPAGFGILEKNNRQQRQKNNNTPD